ncbi:hypothetical protein BHE74_00048504 [Ensete ventricosum]|nr:hypothetical protein BHE74_00048504 [Ensete ventricosum]
MGRSYLRPLSSPSLTMSPHFTTPSVVLAARRASSFLQLRHVDLAHFTFVRSGVRRLTLPCLCQAGSNTSGRPRRRAYCPRARGCDSQVNIRHIDLRPLSSPSLTMSPHFTTPSVVLAARRASSLLQLRHVDLAHFTFVRSAVRRLTLPCLCQASSNTSGRPRRRACCPRARGCGSQVNIRHRPSRDS